MKTEELKLFDGASAEVSVPVITARLSTDDS